MRENQETSDHRTPLLTMLDFPLIVLDLEWNQHYGKQRGDLPQEIVEIGAAKVDSSFVITETLSLLVRPQVHTRMHHHVRRITGIRSAELKEGLSFPEAAVKFFAFCGEQYTLCTWGRDDLPVLWKNLSYWQLTLPPFKNAVNAQMVYAHLFTETPSQQISLAGAMEALGIAADLPAHRALNDAYHTAEILREMNRRLAEEPAEPHKVQELHNAFAEEVLRLSERKAVVSTRCRRLQEVLSDEALATCTCPLCDAKLRPQTPVFPVGRSQRFQQLFACDAHGDILTQLQAQKQQGGFYRVMKRSALTTPERAEKVRRSYLLQPPPKARRRKKGKASGAENPETSE